jgi:hypothetical protein
VADAGDADDDPVAAFDDPVARAFEAPAEEFGREEVPDLARGGVATWLRGDSMNAS